MATQTVEFRSPPSQTVTAKLFAIGSDVQVASVSSTEATNRKGTYSAAYTDVPAGEYELIAFVGSISVARWFVTLTLTTATFQARDKVGAVELDSSSVNAVADQVWDESLSGHTTAGTYGARVVRSTNTNNSVAITGSNHVAADVHAFQTDVIDANALAASAVSEIQAGLAQESTAQSILGDTETNIPTQIANLNDLSADQVNAEVVDALSVDTYTELTSPPAATSSLKDKITWLFMYARNKITQSSTQRKLYRDDGTTVAGTSATSDDGTTFTKGEDA